MSIDSFLYPAEEAIQSLEMSDNIEEERAAQFEPQALRLPSMFKNVVHDIDIMDRNHG
jgi:hypothetical protein